MAAWKKEEPGNWNYKAIANVRIRTSPDYNGVFTGQRCKKDSVYVVTKKYYDGNTIPGSGGLRYLELDNPCGDGAKGYSGYLDQVDDFMFEPATESTATPKKSNSTSDPLSGFYKKSTSTEGPNIKFESLAEVFGIPYQFLPDTDRRLNTDSGKPEMYIGRKYLERIAARAPILFLAPGEPTFMPDSNNEETLSALKLTIQAAKGQNVGGLDDFLKSTGRYYGFEYCTNEYYNYFNPMARSAARYLGIHNEQYYGTGQSLQYYAWNKRATSFKTLFSNAYGAIPFYLDGFNTTSDSFGNSLGESTLAQTLNGRSNYAKQMKYVVGAAASGLMGREISFLEADSYNNIESEVQNLQDFIDRNLTGNKFVSKLASQFVTIANGGQLVFPKIWEDSSYSKSYNLTIKLQTQDADPLSWYLNIALPMFSIICMTLPRGIDVNGYSAPFIVKAYCQSMFNIELGMITDLSISKGAEACWTKDGLPTVVELNLTIADLYENLSISNSSKSSLFGATEFLKNTAEINWIANCCGVDLNKNDILRDAEIWLTHNLANPILDFLPNFATGLSDFLKNWLPSMKLLG